MNDKEKNIELKNDNEITGKISELYNKLAVLSKELYDLGNLLENFLDYRIEYEMHSAKIYDKISGEEITNAKFLDDLKNIIEKNPEIEIDLRLLKYFVEYIDLKKPI